MEQLFTLPTFLILLSSTLLGLSLWLARTSAKGGSALPGCGSSSGCEAVINSRWSRLGPIPIIWLGTVLYGLIAAASIASHPVIAGHLNEPSTATVKSLLAVAVLSAAGAGCWFVFVQAVLLRRFCLYCTVTQALAIAVAVLAAVVHQLDVLRAFPFAAVGVAAMILMQIAWKPRTWAIVPAASEVVESKPPKQEDKLASDELNSAKALSHPSVALSQAPSLTENDFQDSHQTGPSATVPTPNQDNVVATASPPRQITLAGGALKITINDWPLLGPVDAPNVVALLHDPTCKTCRQTHRVATEAVQKANGQVAFLCIPVPQDRACNPSVAPTTVEKKPNDTCQITKLTLTLHRFAPEACHAFEQWFLDFPDSTLPPIDAALRKAQQLAPDAMAKYWPPLPVIENRLKAALTIFQAARATQVPTLVFPRTAVVGLVPTADKLLEIVRSAFEPQLPQEVLHNPPISAVTGIASQHLLPPQPHARQ